MADLCFDVEVVGPDWATLDEPTRGYLTHRWLGRTDKLDGDEHSYLQQPDVEWSEPELRVSVEAKLSQRAALELGLAQIVAIGMWLPDEGRGQVLMHIPGTHGNRVLADGSPLLAYPYENAMLEHVWGCLGRNRLVSFAGRTFDGPVIAVRSAQLGVPITRNLSPYRYDLSEHCDLMDALTFWGAIRGTYSLDFWCRRLDVASPKNGVSGKHVAQLYAAGCHEEIAEYCLRDVRATADLYTKLKSFLSVLKGGPRTA